METVAWIWGGWFVASVGGGLVLVIPNWPPATDPQRWLVFLGFVFLVVGVLGIVAEVVVWWRGHNKLTVSGPSAAAAGHGTAVAGDHNVVGNTATTAGSQSHAITIQGDANVVQIGSGPANAKDDRVIDSVTPAFLVGIYRKHLTAQADALMQPYIGHWIKVSGSVRDVRQERDTWMVFLDLDGIRSDLSAPVLLLVFKDPKAIRRVQILQRDEAIIAIGRIDNVSSSSVVLKDCELA